MDRLVLFVRTAVALLIVATFLVGCGGSSSSPVGFRSPAIVTLTPSSSVSIDIGTIQTFTAGAQDAGNNTLTVPIAFHSSNTAVVTMANNGLACAGTWDSLIIPQICTPGPVGVAEITAISGGVSSVPTTIYVHQHIDSIMVSAVPGQPPPLDPSCFSKDLTFNYRATAFNRGADITPTVGTFTWSSTTAGVVTLNVASPSNQLDGLVDGQVQATASTPGLTSIFATTSNVTSVPFPFTTCLVQSISLEVTGTTSNSFIVTKGTTKTITPTVIDSAGATITGVPLTWCSSNPAAISVGATNCATNTLAPIATTPEAGSAAIIATCTPPACNIGVFPSLPIYPEDVIHATATETGTPPAGTVYVSSQGCGTIDGCFSTIVPVTTPTNTVGNAFVLPATPNSFLYARGGTNAYLGTDFGLLGTRGLIKFDGSALSMFASTIGKVLAISPNGNKVIVSDTLSTPNHVFVFDTSTNGNAALQITGASAADFSPDGLKAYIVAGSTLYVYSLVDALQTIPLNAPANDVSFLSVGAFAYLAGGDPLGMTSWTTCTNTQATPPIATPTVPEFIKSLPDGSNVLAVDPPNIDLVPVITTPIGCPPTLTNGPLVAFNLGQGSFTPIQLIVSSDSTRAYILTSNLPSVLVFDIFNLTSSGIALANSAVPLRASLSTSGKSLYVGAVDGNVHVLDTASGLDIAQISFPNTLCIDLLNNPFPTTCLPDLIAAKP